MSDQNDLDFQTFQVYPDDEPEKTELKPKKGTQGKSIKDKVSGVTSNAFSKNKQKKSLNSLGGFLNKITPATACFIGIGIVFVYIAFDILSSI